MAARDDGEQLSEDVRVQLHDAGDGDGGQRDGGGQDGDYEDMPCSHTSYLSQPSQPLVV